MLYITLYNNNMYIRTIGLESHANCLCKGCRYGQDSIVSSSCRTCGTAAGSTHFSNSHEGTPPHPRPFILLLLYIIVALGYIV